MARAAEQGFDTANPIYHGTDEKFSAFDLDKLGSGKTGALTRRGGSPHGVYLTDSEGYASHFGTPGEYLTNVKNPKVFDYSDWKGGPVWNDPYGKEWYAFREGKPWKDAEANQKFTEHLKEQGYDGVLRKNYPAGIPNAGDRANELVAFDPSQVRSVHATFDPAKRNSADLLASMAGAGLVGAGLYGQYEDERGIGLGR
jgi:hypothetical protein